VVGFTVEESQLAAFDARFDDGDLDDGTYQLLTGDRFYYIVAD
jgi:hypothetical protein